MSNANVHSLQGLALTEVKSNAQFHWTAGLALVDRKEAEGGSGPPVNVHLFQGLALTGTSKADVKIRTHYLNALALVSRTERVVLPPTNSVLSTQIY